MEGRDTEIQGDDFMIKDCLFIAVSILITGLVIFTSCANKAVTGFDKPADKDSGLTVEECIFKLAQTAASSHNSQPWVLKKKSDGLYSVSYVKERWLNEVDPDKKELFLSLGAYLENLRIAAECYGYHADIDIVTSDVNESEIARFFLKKQSGSINHKRIQLMRSSSMAKVKYKKNMGQKEGCLRALLKGQDNVLWIDRSDSRFDYIMEATVEANRIQVWNNEKQKELSDYICFSQDEEDYGVGMTPRMLNLPWFMSRSWYKNSDQESIMSGMFRNGTVRKVKSLMKNSAGLILITGRDNSVHSLLNSGGTFQRLYWDCKESGIELHPVSQILEESPWKEELLEKTGNDKPVHFVLRTGISGKSSASVDSVSSASIRMP